MTAPAPPPRPATSERGVLFTLAGVQFTHIMDFMIMMPLGAGLMRVFNITPELFSWAVAAYGFTAGIAGFLAGFVIDRFDRKRALLGLYAGFGLATLACAFAPTFHWLIVARCAAGAFGGLASSIVTAMVADVVPPERRGRAMGVVMTAFPLASVLGVPVGLTLVDLYEWHAPFLMLAVLSLPIWFTASRFLPSLPPIGARTHAGRQMWEILTHPVHIRGFWLSAVLVFAGGCVIPFMSPAMVANVGLSESQLKYIYIAGGAATLLTTNIIGRLSDRFDKLHVLAAVSVVAVASVLFVTQLGPVPLVVVLALTTLFFVAMSGRFAPAMAMVSNAIEPRYRGGFMSVNAAIQQVASGSANLIAGWMITKNATGHLVGYPRVGYVAVGAFILTVVLGHRLRAAAPHAAKSQPNAAPEPLAVVE